jgi:hypothetical protein
MKGVSTSQRTAPPMAVFGLISGRIRRIIMGRILG